MERDRLESASPAVPSSVIFLLLCLFSQLQFCRDASERERANQPSSIYMLCVCLSRRFDIVRLCHLQYFRPDDAQRNAAWIPREPSFGLGGWPRTVDRKNKPETDANVIFLFPFHILNGKLTGFFLSILKKRLWIFRPPHRLFLFFFKFGLYDKCDVTSVRDSDDLSLRHPRAQNHQRPLPLENKKKSFFSSFPRSPNLGNSF